MGVTRRVTRQPPAGATLILGPLPPSVMHCEFCDSELPDAEPENLALLEHVVESQPCNEQLGYLIENLGVSWTPNMSGG